MTRSVVLGPLLAASVAAQEGPTPSPTPPPIPTANTTTESLEASRLAELPASHDVWSYLGNLDGVAILDRVDNGGLYTGEAARVGVHGSSWTQVSYRLGDLDITDPDRGGTPLLLPGPQYLEALEVAPALMAAGVAGPGVELRLLPRPAAASWHATLGADFVPVGLQSSVDAPAPAIARYDSYGGGWLFLDGPLVKDRLTMALSGSLVRSTRLERDAPGPLTADASGLMAHLSWTPSERDTVRFLGAFEGVTHPYAGRARFGDADVQQDDRFLVLETTWQRQGKSPWAVTGGYVRGTLDPQIGAGLRATTVDSLLDGPVPELFPGRPTRERAQLLAHLDSLRRSFARGEHVLRFGLSGDWTRVVTRPEQPPGPTAETVDGLPARVWFYGWAGPESRWRGIALALEASDAARYGPLSLEAGLRFQSTSASAAADPATIDWNNLSPRVRGRLRLIRDDSLALLAGYAHYAARLPLDLLAYGDPTGPQGLVYRWDDANHDGTYEPGELGPLVARAGPGAPAAIDPALAAPTTDEVVAGLEARLGRAWRLRLLGIHRREHDLLASVDVGAPTAAYTVSYVNDPGGDLLSPADDQLLPIYDRRPDSFGQDRYLLTNTSDNVLHEGVEVALDARLGQRFWWTLGATASRTEGPGANRGYQVDENDAGLIGERLEDPNAATFSRGRLFFDRAFTLKISAAYRAPGDLTLGIVARYQDGQPFSRMLIAPSLNQGPEAIQAIPNGRSRFSYTLTLDARLEKAFGVGRARAAAVLEVFNLLDQANEVEEDVVTGPAFRTETAVQPPRAFRLGMRLSF